MAVLLITDATPTTCTWQQKNDAERHILQRETKNNTTTTHRQNGLASLALSSWGTTPGGINQKDVLLRPFCPRLRYG